MSERTRICDKAIAIAQNINDMLKSMGATECMASPYCYTNYLSKNPVTRVSVRIRGLQKYPRELAEQIREEISERFCESLVYRENTKAIRFMDFFLE